MPRKTTTDPSIPQISAASTKQEMLAAYEEMVGRLKEKREAELRPQQRAEEKQVEEAVQVADSLSTDGIAREVGGLRSEISKLLTELSDRMEAEVGRYVHLKRAVEAREKELAELSAIEKEALSLAALIEAQTERREQFDVEIAERKESLEAEIASTRAAWKEEQKAHDGEIQARETVEKKKREREAEEYTYAFERQKRLAKEQFEYEKARTERETLLRREDMERDLAAREQAVGTTEAELAQLRERAAAFPKELASAVEKAIKETTTRLSRESEGREALLTKEFEGEQKVLQSRIDSLQQALNDQQQLVAKLSAQIERSYGQVQEIAVKAIEGSGAARAGAALPAADRQRPAGQGEI